MNKTLLITVAVLVSLLVPPVAVAQDGSDDAYVNDPRFGESSVNTEAGVAGSPGKSSEGRVPSSPSDAPKPRVDVLPSCAVIDIEESGPPLTNCTPRACENGEPEYVRFTEDLQGGGPKTEFFCGAPDADPGALAIDEFYTNTVTVSAPTIAPETTTFANFPNIFWSDVVAYEESTGITVANVRLKFIPVSYVWDFGDGETMTTTDPGKPRDRELTKYIQDIEKNYDITHRFHKLGTFDVTLTVVFNGQYSVNGGGWVDIAGSLSATSPPHPLRVREARGELVAPGGN